MKHYKNPSANQVLLAFFIVTFIGFGGALFYVRQTFPRHEPYIEEGSYMDDIGGEALTPDTAAWERVISGDNTFSVAIPEGWTVYNDMNSGYIATTNGASGLIDTAGKAPVITATPPDTANPDAPTRFSISTHTKPVLTEDYTSEPFDTVDGIKGIRYQHYQRTANSHGSGLRPGDTTYDYVFAGDGISYHVHYRVNQGEPDRRPFVEAVIRTLDLSL